MNVLSFLKILFWFSVFLVFYSYIGYGILLWLLVAVKRIFIRPKTPDPNYLPAVALVVAAYNEEDYISDKIANSFALDYPKELLELVFITDGSSDSTPDIIARHERIKLLHQPDRRGKAAAMNRSIEHINSPILVFCDANTMLNPACIREIVKHYQDPKVGGVAGEKKIIQDGINTAAATGEGLYWKYESVLKKLDSDLYSTVGAAGELFSVRKELFEAAPEGTIIEDFVQSLTVCTRGYVLRYEPNAFAAEAPSASIRDEMKRKVRICAGAFQAMILLKELFNIFRYPVLSFQFISHRVLRWTLCPIALIVILLTNLALVAFGTGNVYMYTLIAQLVFYGMAVTGWMLATREIRVKILYVPFYFFFMNLAVFLGFRRFIRNKQSVLWEKASRQKLPKYH
ncbi:MAG: glycosyltransferase family 2 protein [Chitinophagaceae bacterium]|nr:glycosyltransferase family 2 protein [Chitinophagaceae bacterium]